jgi:preprotein translocase subunit YajC
MMSSPFLLFLLQSGASGLWSFLPLILMFVAMYFLLIVPQRKRQQKVQNMLNDLKIGDNIVTSGGIYGTITVLDENKKTVQIKIADNPTVRIRIARTAISGLQGGEELGNQ